MLTSSVRSVETTALESLGPIAGRFQPAFRISSSIAVTLLSVLAAGHTEKEKPPGEHMAPMQVCDTGYIDRAASKK